MKLTIAKGSTIYQIDGTLLEISQIVNTLIGSDTSVPDSSVKNPALKIENLKVTKFPKPKMTKLDDATANILESLFAYPMNKNTDPGRPAYVAAILLDGQPHTVSDIKIQANAITTKPIHTAVERLRKSGSTVKLSTKKMTPSTVVQVTKINKNVKPVKFKKTSTSRSSFKNLSI